MVDIQQLRDIETSLAEDFNARRQVLSFDEFFTLFCESPRQFLRTAPEYIRDCIQYYGTEEIAAPGGPKTRYTIFDCPWNGGNKRVVGQEAAQGQLFRLLNNFVREGQVTRLILLHGPNGSAKSSLVECLAHGMEEYAKTDEGAFYHFNWVFPTRSVAKRRLGFQSNARGPLTSYAHLPAEEVDARMPADLHDHPLLLLPADKRGALIDKLRGSGKIGEDIQIADYITHGDLAPRSHAIFEALLSAYHGDVQRVLQHIQVERFYFSRRYRLGLVTIEPQLHVDAGVRQVTMDKGLQSLPTSLQSLSLYEPFGDLVDANRGLLNFNDLLKKPVDAFKYLLSTSERGTVALPQAILHLDVVFVASSNEKHLRAFKEFPDWPSFKGRLDLVKMPYIRDFRVEQTIYDEQVAAGGLQAHLVPHATELLALWAVLTRLRRPRAEMYPTAIRDVVGRLSALEKAELYSDLRTPRDLAPEEARELRALMPELMAEGQERFDYEGAFGASPREMKQVLLNALQNTQHWGISPLGVVAELRELVRSKSVYDYLRMEADGGYHDVEGFIDQVTDRYLEIVDNELRGAMGLVQDQQYDDLFARYILHVSYLLKGEKLYNAATGRSERPDKKLIDQLERVWDVPGDADVFRRDLISRVGAWRVEFQGGEIDYRLLFPKLFEQLEAEYYTRQKVKVQRMGEQMLTLLIAEDVGADPTHHGIAAADIARAEETIAAMQTRYGYSIQALREVMSALLKARY